MSSSENSVVTPEWLTNRLRTNGYPVSAQSITASPREVTSSSTIWHLKVKYAEDTDLVSNHLFLKIPAKDIVWGRHEVKFYQEIVPQMKTRHPNLPLVHCYDAVWHPNTGYAYLLMDDLTESHFAFGSGPAPARAHYEQIVIGFAMIHAYWHEHPELDRFVGQPITAEQIAEGIAHCQSKLPDLLRDLSDHLSSNQQETLELVAKNWPQRRRDRILAGQGVTLVHRDPHRRNFLYPRQDGLTRIIDWESWRVDTGTDDLAYMMACHWDEIQRGELELVLLHHYYHALQNYGVVTYRWTDCQYDYRASIVRCLFFLINAWNKNQQELKWERIRLGLLAFDQWRCTEILV